MAISLDDLVDQLTKAKGAHRDIDMMIVDFIHPGKRKHPAEYTGSIDAALTLVPPNHRWWINSEEINGAGEVLRPSGNVIPFGKDMTIADSKYAATPAIVICIAALKARANSQ